METRATLWIVALASFALSACSSMANKSPDEMVRYAIQHNLTRDNQYNFEGKAYIDQTADDNAAAVAADAAGVVADSTGEASAAAAETTASVRDDNNAGQTEVGYSRWMAHWTQSVSIPYSGAVDIPNGRFELVPELRYDTRNALMSVKLPMQLDMKDVSLLIDPAAVAPFADMFGGKTMRPIGDKLVRIRLPEKVKQRIPLQSIMSALPKAYDDGYAAIGKQAYQQLTMDDAGRAMGARYRIGLDMDMAQSRAVAAAMLNSLHQQLADAAKNRPQAGISAEDYQNTLEVLAWLAKPYGKPSAATADTMAEAAEAAKAADAAETLALEQADKMLLDLKTHSEFYLDRRGRILAVRQGMAFPGWITALLGSRKSATAVNWLRFHYTKKPMFTLQATPQNTLALSQLFPEWDRMLGNMDMPATTDSAKVASLRALQDEFDDITVTVEPALP